MENPYINTLILPGLGTGVAAAINTNFINVETAFGEIVDEITTSTGVVSRDTVVSGLAVTDDTGLYVNLALGVAIISGTRVIVEAATSHLLTATKNNFIDIDSAGLVVITAQTIGVEEPAIAADTIRLAMVVTNSNDVVKVYDKRNLSNLNVPMKFTPEGGLAVYVNLVESVLLGEVLNLDSTSADMQFSKITIGDVNPTGIAYEDIAAGCYGWMVVSGIAYVLPTSGAKLTRGDHVVVSASVNGRADGSASVNIPQHWQEIGHCCETSSGNGVAARCIIHFN